MRRSRELSRGSAPDLRGFFARAALSSSFSFPSASSDGSGGNSPVGEHSLGQCSGSKGSARGSRGSTRGTSLPVWHLVCPGRSTPLAFGCSKTQDMASGDGAGGGRWTNSGMPGGRWSWTFAPRGGKRRSEDALNWRTTTRRARRSTGRVRVRAGGSARTSGKRLAAGSGRFRVQRLEKSYFRIFQGRGGKRARRLSVENSTRASLRAALRDAGRGGDGAGRGTRNPVADPSSRSEGETRSDRKRVAGAIRSRATRPTCPSHNV